MTQPQPPSAGATAAALGAQVYPVPTPLSPTSPRRFRWRRATCTADFDRPGLDRDRLQARWHLVASERLGAGEQVQVDHEGGGAAVVADEIGRQDSNTDASSED